MFCDVKEIYYFDQSLNKECTRYGIFRWAWLVAIWAIQPFFFHFITWKFLHFAIWHFWLLSRGVYNRSSDGLVQERPWCHPFIALLGLYKWNARAPSTLWWPPTKWSRIVEFKQHNLDCTLPYLSLANAMVRPWLIKFWKVFAVDTHAEV